MKLSKYNIIKNVDEGILIYNTITGGVLHLNEEYKNKFELLKNTGIDEDVAPDLFENLKKGRMIISDDIDETQYLLMRNNIVRFSDYSKVYTIAPTMKCNFRCPYCYEKNAIYETMSKDVIEAVKSRFKDDKEESKVLSICWYGGEPLLAFDIIEELSEKAIELFGNNYFASIVTNGYLLSEDIAIKMNKIKIINMQITIDGPPEIHNLRRKLPNNQDTFYVIIKNIQDAIRVYPELKITIRVNTDKTNIGHVDDLLEYLDEYGLKEKVNLYLAPVDNINGTCNSTLCFNNNEFAAEQIKFIKRNLEKGYNFVNLPQVNFYICGAVASNSLVIDAGGNLYKCWDDVGSKAMKAGSIFDSSPQENINMTQWLSYNVGNEKACIECSFLPICMGGCPNHRIKTGKSKCLPIKENVDDMIELLYKSHKMKKETV